LLLKTRSPKDMHLGKISDKCHLINPESIYVAEGATIEAFASVEGPAWIETGATVRHSAYIRGNVYVGQGAIVGHTTEAKGTILLPQAKAAHFAYLGDSVLGVDVNLGAGTKLANLRLDHGQVKLRAGNDKLDSGLKKLGAILGNRSQTGCNTVTNPGTVLLPNSFLLPNSTGLGVIRPKQS
jgi:UDP-N-acetylglucosamine diphosphorylase / glucose-1-phosphate thymidylyltransferase / UDP-N-acetylgalactosamine diphosphorylase / glucosamine-1-phosphate N-acetyltransferase / galactosamine-1-phosphate N-acetyltransferase